MVYIQRYRKHVEGFLSLNQHLKDIGDIKGKYLKRELQYQGYPNIGTVQNQLAEYRSHKIYYPLMQNPTIVLSGGQRGNRLMP